MAKAVKLPKLKWVKDGDRDWIAGQFSVARSISCLGLWAVMRNGKCLCYAVDASDAKAIAQAFADAETLRGEGG